MRVLVLGATGFIGNGVAQAFVRNGHFVYGQTRSSSKAAQLAAQEMTPVVADPTKPETWTQLLQDDVDLVIDCSASMADLKSLAESIVSAVKEAGKKRPSGYPPLNIIYTSGTWNHGNNRTKIVTELSPTTSPMELVAWRSAVEKTVLGAPEVNGIVIRPGLLYGYSASLLATLFEQAEATKQVSWYGKPGGRLGAIHIDDLADLYLRVGEASPTLKGIVFDVVNPASESTDDVLRAIARVTGADPNIVYKEITNPFEACMASSQICPPSLGRALLGWFPKKRSLVDGMDQYYAAWKASRS
ncbi:hypothetical protein BZG36_00094 [Bifiguratus adelaidae]|uniref:NAD(P)-binding domain-containing protein n=1 Tax=Bifiguratus adelaidae TaxID=1938954 RepID=A0A261Y8Y4_9FUNG|nr:hypothetical protein BZG36_00094 [Bifiguratus adelaidae]